jgi:transposase-like protein
MQTEDDTLSDRQRIAVESLVSGATVTEAAEVAGVSRQTVHSWMHLPQFTAGLNRRRQERDQLLSDCLRRVLGSALTTVARAVEEEEDLEASFKLLRIVGAGPLLQTAAYGPTTEEDVRIAEALEESTRTMNRLISGAK